MAGMLQMRRSRGAASGFLLVLLGLWGALIPFIGPYFHYAYTPDTAWTYTAARLWLEVLPGAAVFLGGILLIIATGRHVALFGALLAAAAGAWFTLGTILSPLWNNHVTLGGSPVASTQFKAIMEQIGFFSALGLVIVFIAAAAFGRILSVTSGIRTVETIPAAETVPPAERVPATETVPPAERVPATETVPTAERVPATETVPTAERVPATETVPPAERVPARTGPTLTLPFRRTRTETVPAEQARDEDTQTIG
jgi:hypothetical protein